MAYVILVSPQSQLDFGIFTSLGFGLGLGLGGLSLGLGLDNFLSLPNKTYISTHAYILSNSDKLFLKLFWNIVCISKTYEFCSLSCK